MNKVFETFLIAVRALKANKIRSFLTMLGVIIGVFSVVSLVALGNGIQNFVEDQFSALGSNLVIVAPGKVDFTDDPAKSFNRNKLEEKHVDLIESYAEDYIIDLTPSYRIGKSAEYKNKDYASTVIGVNERAQSVLNFELEEGRFFTRSELRSKANVAVIGDQLRKEFFSNTEPIGKYVEVEGEKFEVIGVIKKKNERFDDGIIAPYTTVEDTFNLENFSSIGIKVEDTDNLRRAMLNIELAMLRDLKEDDFSVVSQQEILGSIQNILQILTLGLGAIAGISLIVGGIGIMNIMLVSVTERTREIGLRKALGATPNDISLQFITESVLLSAMGGIIGLMLGFIVTFAAQSFVRAEVPLYAVVMAFGFSLAVGVIFGTYPALRASRLDPIEALRYE